VSERPRSFEQRDPTRWFLGFLVALAVVAVLIAMNKYL
jgi:hypothetical protein